MLLGGVGYIHRGPCDGGITEKDVAGSGVDQEEEEAAGEGGEGKRGEGSEGTTR